ncbi:uncharacterized protein LOC122086028 isoform X2 [Macadamia integrifolia]|uniref:uncharacterized protein LOC122086028 isoform X2 n=1 Tax=Macadamia integrifolia TaxID=60698 RepID=UPI001C5000D8|nr:uncharacterized protein LOC122086028 isoform X2 [Macadamia integrifolia]
MLRVKRLMKARLCNTIGKAALTRLLRGSHEEELFFLPSQKTFRRSLDIYQVSADEMNRGYFADISELKKHGGKIAMANKIIIPAISAAKFPTIEVNFSDGKSIKLPIVSEGNGVKANEMVVPAASLLCLSFRASSQAMIDSWTVPVLEAFRASSNLQIYEVSFIDSWLLSMSPIKRLLLRIMRKSNADEKNNALQRQFVYSFGDHYYFRKELKILNLLTGYIFLLDKFGRIRWQGFGLATKEELVSLLSCTSLLLEEK